MGVVRLLMAFALSDFIAASSGGAAAVCTTVALYPIDVVKANINRGKDQHGVPFDGVSDVVKRIYDDAWLSGFYKGVFTRTTQQFVQKFSFYYAYASLRRIAGEKTLTFWPNLFLGYLAGVASVVGSNPLELVSTRQQTGSGKAKGFFQVVQVLDKSGPLGLWDGVSSNLILSINPAIENTLFDQLKDMLLKKWSQKVLSTFAAFWLGAFVKFIATLLTFPLIRAKTIMQAGSTKGKKAAELEKENAKSAALASPVREDLKLSNAQILKTIIEQDGFFAMWKGMSTQSVKAVLSSAFLLASKEKIQAAVRYAIMTALEKRE